MLGFRFGFTIFLHLSSLIFVTTGNIALQGGDENPLPVSERYFARHLYQRLSLASGGGNLVVCPLSVYLLLAVLTEGAVGSARLQLLKVLGLQENVRAQCVRKYAQTMMKKESSIQLVSRIFVDKSHPVDKDFLSISQNYYDTGVETVKFTNKIETAAEINSYVMETTNHTIRDIITEGDLSGDASMICVSTIHIKDRWTLPFVRGRTSRQPFHTSPLESIHVDMMYLRNHVHFLWDGTLQTKILSLELSTKGLRMVFFLPDQNLSELESNLSSLDLIPFLKGVESAPPVTVDVWLPTFRVVGDFNLEKTLQQMGLTSLFSPQGELTGISCCGGLKLSKVRQKLYIVVEENGVEASSATHAVLGNGVEDREIQEFRADRPFAFYLLLDDEVMFQGRVVKPSAS